MTVWRPGDTGCFPFVLTHTTVEVAIRAGQIEPIQLDGLAMLSTTRAAIHRNPEITAILATYGVFLGALLALAWMIA